ncbi:hypothetical protein [Rubritalea marina]|uniref:hypothetical protein n=1 Tax=Rubritalea marina TaxID=361055 RepID=UPI001969A567|nr:hypothetical protein [Rubritalea marina]
MIEAPSIEEEHAEAYRLSLLATESERSRYLSLPADEKHLAFEFPPASSGRYAYLIRVARFMTSLGKSDEKWMRWIFDLYDDGKDYRRYEDVVKDFDKALATRGETIQRKPSAFAPPRERLKDIRLLEAYEPLTLDALEELQAETPLGDDIDASTFVSTLFAPNDLVWVADRGKAAWEKPRTASEIAAELREADADENPYFYTTGSTFLPDAHEVKTTKGRKWKSYKLDVCVAERKYMILEMDQMTKELHSRALSFVFSLEEVAPLASVVFSGGESYHCYLNVQGYTERALGLLHKLACLHGADSGVAQTPSNATRFPNVSPCREKLAVDPDRKAQDLLYLNPEAASRRATDTMRLEKALEKLINSALTRSVEHDEQTVAKVEEERSELALKAFKKLLREELPSKTPHEGYKDYFLNQSPQEINGDTRGAFLGELFGFDARLWLGDKGDPPQSLQAWWSAGKATNNDDPLSGFNSVSPSLAKMTNLRDNGVHCVDNVQSTPFLVMRPFQDSKDASCAIIRILEGEGLTLRAVTDEEDGRLTAWFDKPRGELLQWLHEFGDAFAINARVLGINTTKHSIPSDGFSDSSLLYLTLNTPLPTQ